MIFDSSLYWLVLLAAAASCQLLPPERIRLRAALLIGGGIWILLSVLRLEARLVALTGAVIVWILVGLRLTSGLAARSSMHASLLVMAPVLGLWVVGKAAVGLGFGPLQFLYFLGFSYFVVKAWTLVKDVHDRRIAPPDPVVAAAYFLFFPTYVAGPMHLYGEFETSLRTPKPLDGEAVVDVVFRVLLGLVKLKLITPLLTPVSLLAIPEGGATPSRLVVGAFVYSVVLWADFSGYSDLAIATSRIVGIVTPENFRRPYAASNIRDFWQRWHITFSRILTSYVFIPLSRALQRRLGGRRNTTAAITYVCTFLFCGYWHGATLNFVAWGLYHGLGMLAYDLFKADPARLRSLAPATRRVRTLLSVGATFVFVSLGWILFVLPLERWT